MADGTLKVGTITTSSGSGTITLGQSGETLALGSGVTSQFNQPAFQAELSANQEVTDNTDTKVQFDTEIFDTDNCYDNSTNYRFTPTVAGKYYVYLNLGVNGKANSNLNVGYSYIYKNGSSVAYTNSRFFQGGNTSNGGTVATPFISAIFTLNGSSDYVELYGKINALDNSNVHTINTIFGAYRIGS